MAWARTDASANEHSAPSLDAAPRAIASWLLVSGVQSAVEPHRGGVVGWLDADGHAEYVYPEITGYYLQWLAWIATGDGVSTRLAHGAAMAQRWLAAWIERTDPPETRVYLHASPDERPNKALLFFLSRLAPRRVPSPWPPP